jgi:hypothetical protein
MDPDPTSDPISGQVLIVAKLRKDKKYKDSEEQVRKSPPKMCRIRDPKTGINSSRIQVIKTTGSRIRFPHNG